MKTISLTERTIRHIGHGVVGTFTFAVGGDGPPTTFQVAIEHPHHDVEALELAAWQRASRQAMASKPGPRQVADHPIMPQIEHVVVLMLENRGFDHVMGWLYEQDQPKVNLPSANVPANQQGLPTFIGLDPRSLAAQRLSLEALTNKLTEPSDDGEVLKTLAAVAPRRGARSPTTPNHNPGEFYQHILAHLFDYPYEQIPSFDPARITQRGYLADYFREGFSGYQLDDAVVEKVSEIMDTYLPEQLPILNGLARHYAVSDLWFCSVPSQTNTNRAFLAAGTARGMVKNGFYGKNSYYAWLNSDTLPADTRTVFDVLEETGHGDQWMYFWHSSWPPTKLGENQYTRIMFPQLAADRYDAQFAKMDEFYERAAAGTLPAVSFIEPEWGGGKTLDALAQLNGNDYHPVSDTTKGEDFVLQVYRALATGPAWNKTLFLITFDENGGTYDHVPPPKALASDVDKAPQGYKNNDLDAHTRTQFGFTFDLYGVRIPTLAISPWIAPQTVFRSPTAVPYDHTSVNATILTWLGVPADRWKLGQRTAAAPTFDQVLTLGQPRPPGDRAVGINFGTPPTRAPNAVALTYGMKIKLKYIGNKWPYAEQLDEGQYLGPVSQSTPLAQYYPTLGPASDAIVVKLASATKADGQPVLGDDLLQLVTTEAKVGDYSHLGAWRTHFLYYYKPGYPEENWQIRLPSYRMPAAPIFVGDEVIFLSVRHPYQRMTADADQPQFLTTRLGDWAYWRLVG